MVDKAIAEARSLQEWREEERLKAATTAVSLERIEAEQLIEILGKCSAAETGMLYRKFCDALEEMQSHDHR